MTTRNRTFLTLAVVAMACFALTTSANAAVIDINTAAHSRIDDLDNDGDGDALVHGTDVAYWAAEYQDNSQAVWAFQMTGVANPAEITTADFSTSMDWTVGPIDFEVDAYVIRVNAASTILVGDYEAAGTSLMEGFDDGTGAAAKSLNGAGQTALGTYLSDNWTADHYVFIGLRSDPLTLSGDTKVRRYAAASELSITTEAIPEPATMCALTLAVAGLGGYIRKRRRT